MRGLACVCVRVWIVHLLMRRAKRNLLLSLSEYVHVFSGFRYIKSLQSTERCTRIICWLIFLSFLVCFSYFSLLCLCLCALRIAFLHFTSRLAAAATAAVPRLVRGEFRLCDAFQQSGNVNHFHQPRERVSCTARERKREPEQCLATFSPWPMWLALRGCVTGIFSVAGGTVCLVGTVVWEQFKCEQLGKLLWGKRQLALGN